MFFVASLIDTSIHTTVPRSLRTVTHVNVEISFFDLFRTIWASYWHLIHQSAKRMIDLHSKRVRPTEGTGLNFGHMTLAKKFFAFFAMYRVLNNFETYFAFNSF